MKFTAHIEALYQELPFEERFSAAKKDGFDYVEIWDWINKDLDQIIESGNSHRHVRRSAVRHVQSC